MEDITHLEPRSWFGQFLFPNSDVSIPGRLTYSLSEGLRVDWVGHHSVPSLERIQVMEGLLEGGYQCLLINTSDVGMFDPLTSYRSSYRCGVAYPEAVLFDAGAGDSAMYEELIIRVKGLDEFCIPEGSKVPESLAHGYQVPPYAVGDHHVSIWRGATYSHTDATRAASRLYATDKSTREAVDIAIVRSDGSSSEFEVAIRQDVRWNLSINYQSPETIGRLLEDSRELLSLFALLFHKPVVPITISARRPRNEDGHGRNYRLLIARPMHLWAAEHAKQEVSAYRLPFRLEDIDFGKTLAAWSVQKDDGLFRYLKHQIESQSGLVAAYDLYAQAVLLCTFLEDANSALRGKPKERYSRPITAWATAKSVEALLGLAHVATLEEFGEVLSTLRNEIAHPQRQKVLLPAMKDGEIHELCYIIETVLFSYALTLLGIAEDIALKAQTKILFGG